MSHLHGTEKPSLADQDHVTELTLSWELQFQIKRVKLSASVKKHCWCIIPVSILFSLYPCKTAKWSVERFSLQLLNEILVLNLVSSLSLVSESTIFLLCLVSAWGKNRTLDFISRVCRIVWCILYLMMVSRERQESHRKCWKIRAWTTKLYFARWTVKHGKGLFNKERDARGFLMSPEVFQFCAGLNCDQI